MSVERLRMSLEIFGNQEFFYSLLSGNSDRVSSVLKDMSLSIYKYYVKYQQRVEHVQHGLKEKNLKD